jgi:hypothetical protein
VTAPSCRAAPAAAQALYAVHRSLSRRRGDTCRMLRACTYRGAGGNALTPALTARARPAAARHALKTHEHAPDRSHLVKHHRAQPAQQRCRNRSYCTRRAHAPRAARRARCAIRRRRHVAAAPAAPAQRVQRERQPGRAGLAGAAARGGGGAREALPVLARPVPRARGPHGGRARGERERARGAERALAAGTAARRGAAGAARTGAPRVGCRSGALKRHAAPPSTSLPHVARQAAVAAQASSKRKRTAALFRRIGKVRRCMQRAGGRAGAVVGRGVPAPLRPQAPTADRMPRRPPPASHRPLPSTCTSCRACSTRCPRCRSPRCCAAAPRLRCCWALRPYGRGRFTSCGSARAAALTAAGASARAHARSRERQQVRARGRMGAHARSARGRPGTVARRPQTMPPARPCAHAPCRRGRAAGPGAAARDLDGGQAPAAQRDRAGHRGRGVGRRGG